MSDPEAPIRGFGWTSGWIKREPAILVLVLLIIVVVGIVNVSRHGDHSRTGVNAIGGPTSPVGGVKH
jgi:hypothetical protein